MTLPTLKMTAELGREAEYFQSYSGDLCDDLRFEMLVDGLVIHLEQQPNNIRYKHSYSEHRFFKRAQQSNQALLKACNNKQRSIKTVLDLTGGWGMDSFILACHGQTVTCIEQNTLVHKISAYSLHCARAIKHSAMAANRVEMVHADSVDYLRKHAKPGVYDCIYLDPMFPDHKSSAKPAKSLQILQKLTHNHDIQTCFELALGKASKRVVVKSPAKSVALFEDKADLVYREKTIRFEVFLIASHENY